MDLQIEVTASDIAYGAPRCPDRCPAALSILRATGARHVSVGPRIILVEYIFRTKTYHTSWGLERFIEKFDEGFIVEPGIFTLEER